MVFFQIESCLSVALELFIIISNDAGMAMDPFAGLLSHFQLKYLRMKQETRNEAKNYRQSRSVKRNPYGFADIKSNINRDPSILESVVERMHECMSAYRKCRLTNCLAW